jgi:calcineurin-like phosphoesterase family protein
MNNTLKFKTENVWITSDTHYGHKNICRGTTDWRLPDGSVPVHNTRDFASVEEMNEAIIKNINDVVMADDVLLFLGDWSFGGFDNIQKFRDRVACQNIHLIFGNHDHHIENNKNNVQSLFSSVSHYRDVLFNNIKIKLMHYPISSWNGLSDGVLHLHGHMHFTNNKRFGSGKRMDVGLDGNPNFAPYSLKECVKILESRPIKSEFMDDHHLDGM